MRLHLWARKLVGTLRAETHRPDRTQLRLEVLEDRTCASARPNIVLINTDDQRADTLDVMPQLTQALATSGTVFTNSFVTTALCCPSRASTLTGQYAHNHGVLGNAAPFGGFTNFNDTSTLATWMHDAGYHTGLIGKYFNEYASTYVPPGWDDWHAFVDMPDYFNYRLNENGQITQFGSKTYHYSTDVLAGKAVDYVNARQANPAQPFFLYFTPYAPHDNSHDHVPPTPAPRHVGALTGLTRHRPPSFNEADIQDKPTWVERNPRLTAPEVASLDLYRQRYLETLLSLDEAVGRLVTTIQAAGQWDNTVIIYTSDNGMQLGEHRLHGKASAFEESIRVPLIIRDGRQPLARTADRMVLNIDLAPTVLRLAGLSIPDSVDGRSLVPLLRGPQENWRSEFLVENWNGKINTMSGVRTTRWKYVAYTNGDRELYDLVNDPYELQNLYGNPSYQQQTNQLSAQLRSLKSNDKQGPITTDVAVTPDRNGGSFTVTAIASDLTTGGNQVRTGEFFIDTVQRFFNGMPLLARDGMFTSATEVLAGTLPATALVGLAPGYHTVYIHGRDVAGNWGPMVTTTFWKDAGTFPIGGTGGRAPAGAGPTSNGERRSWPSVVSDSLAPEDDRYQATYWQLLVG